MTYGLIISAGNQTRYKSERPKALAKIGTKTLLDINVHNMMEHCDRVVVVCSATNKDWFKGYDSIEIESGYGCGDAVYKAIKRLGLQDSNDNIFIQWGDSKHESFIYKRLIDEYGQDDERYGRVLIPCVIEDRPYVQIMPNMDNVEVLFSKYGEKTEHGWHDLSLFYGSVSALYKHLDAFHKAFWKTDHYEHKHNNEFQFLDVFNETCISARVIDMGNYEDFSFNTIEEFEAKTSK